MLKTIRDGLLVLLIGLVPIQAQPAQDNFSTDIPVVMDQLSKMYRASMGYIFANQELINQIGDEKPNLFGDKFIENVKVTYKKRFGEEFPELDHPLKRMLSQVMVEVMEDNRTLILDKDITYKGFIPAIFAFQLSEKLSSKGLGVKIKFTNTKDMIRNKLNSPDEWESYAMQIIKKLNLGIHFDSNTTFDNKPAYRHFVPIKMQPMCLHCHGEPQDNPLNKDKPKSQWTDIDVAGFTMENWKLNDFGGGVSVTVYKKDF